MDSLKNWLNNTSFDFVGWRYIMGGISAAMVLLAWVAFIAIGPNWGIDFTGGTEVQLKFQDSDNVTIEDKCQLHNTVVCRDAVVGARSTLKESQVGPRYEVPASSEIKKEALFVARD